MIHKRSTVLERLNLFYLQFNSGILLQFKAMAHLVVILTSITTINLDSLFKSYSYNSLVGTEILKHKNFIPSAHRILLGVLASLFMSML